MPYLGVEYYLFHNNIISFIVGFIINIFGFICLKSLQQQTKKKQKQTNKKIEQINFLFGQKTNQNWNKVPAEDSENKEYTESNTY